MMETVSNFSVVVANCSLFPFQGGLKIPLCNVRLQTILTVPCKLPEKEQLQVMRISVV